MRRSRRIPVGRTALKLRARSTIVPHAWRLLTLTWRKWPRSVTSRGHARGAIVRNRWSPRFTLNLKLAFITPARTKVPTMSARFEMAILRRNLLTNRTLLQAVPHWLPGTDSLRSNRIMREFATRESRLQESKQTEVRTVFRMQTLPAGVAHHGRRSPKAAPHVHRTFSYLRHDTIKIHRSQKNFRTSRHVRNVTTTHGSDLVFMRQPGRHVQVSSRPPELVWRADAQPSMIEAIERSISAATSSTAPLGNPPAGHVEQSLAPSDPSPAVKFDAAVLDRVAEDVIGRVEKRIRIERERRGV